MCDLVNITFFDGSKATKSFQGSFNCKVTFGNQEIQINECSYFNTGERKWVNLPSRKMKDESGKLITVYGYVQFLTSPGRFETLALDALKQYFAREGING